MSVSPSRGASHDDRAREGSGRASFQHASAEEFKTFVHSCLSSRDYRRTLMLVRERFVESYPDLNDWFSAPLAERVGRLWGEPYTEPSYPVSYRARPYLFFLSLHRYALFDWEWLIALPQLNNRSYTAHVGLRESLGWLMEDAVRLGYVSTGVEGRLKWALGRIFLHTADSRVEAIDDELLLSFSAALHGFVERPDVHLFYGPPEKLKHLHRHHRGCLYLLHNVLYHRGQVDAEPRITPTAATEEVLG